MLWWTCGLSSFMCGSEEEVERRVSLSIMSRLAIPVKLGIMLGMWCLGFCGTEAHPCCRKKVFLIERKIPPLHELRVPGRFFKFSERAR